MQKFAKDLLAQVVKFFKNPTDLAFAASLLGDLGPAAKAIVPAALTVVATVVIGVTSGKWDSLALSTAITGLVGSVVVYFIPNKPAGK